MKKQYRLRKRLLTSLISAAVATSAAGPTISWAQTADATLRGKAAANSEVTAKNTATGAVRRTKAADDGSYALVGLPPGTYQVDAGPGTERTVTLAVASTSTLDFEAGAPAPSTTAPTLEGISVTAASLADVKTSEVGGTVSLHQIQTVPQISRNFLEFADTVPGMAFTVDASGHTSLRGGAQNNNSTNVYIDGVGQKSYVKEGGVSGQFSSQGNPFPQLAIGEYKVITSNYKAEYDQISGAAVTAETKSGTNEFHGEIFGTYTGDKYRKETPAEEAAGKQAPSKEEQYGFAIGGPIIQDQMHFFLSYEAKRFTTPVTVVPGVTDPPTASLLPASAQGELGPTNKTFDEDLYFGKIDWEFSDRDRIELSAKVRREDSIDNVGSTTAPSAAIDTLNDDTRIDARWQHSADNWFNELLITHEKAFNDPSAQSLGNGAIYTYGPKQDALILSTGPASPLSTQHKGQEGPSIGDNLTFNNLNWYGDHVVKVGFKYKDVKLTAADAALNNPQFYYNVTDAGTEATPWKVFFPAAAPGLSPTSESKNKQFGTYIQDDWAVNEHLTLNLGVRWDYEESPAYLDYVTPANVVAALNAPNPDPHAPAGQTYAQALALGGVNINDYISNGHNRSAQKNEWQPRLGFSYDLNGDEQHVIFGGAGRAYDRDLFDYLQVEQTKQALSEFTYYFQGANGACRNNSTPCIAWDPKYLNGLENLSPLVAASNVGKEVDAINNNLKAPYSDQFSIGMRNKLGDWNTSAAYARINSKDGLAFTLGNRYPNGDFWASCGATCTSQPWGNGVPGFGNFIIANNGIETKTNQVLLSADKPYTLDSGWSATFAYTYTDAKQNRDIGEHYSFDEETIHQYPFILSNAAARHRFVATGSIDGPWGLLFGGKLTLATPIPHNDLACYGILYPTGSYCTPIAGTPSGGGTVNDPHATGAQSLGFGNKIFGYRAVDFQMTKNFDLTAGYSLYVRFDVLNVFNFHNYSDYITNYGANGVANPYPVSFNSIGNITGVPRTFKFTAGFRF
ncbi:MAG TPA: TonB-dependent receptor [Rhodanobacteraceae bacterium]|nr:TonB-dependent receptor [Rhodanobacteraceae bacterium]